jgi:hypothetical protein
MTLDEIQKAIELLIDLAGRQQKTVTDLLEVQKAFQQSQEILQQNQKRLQDDFIALQNEIRNYIRGLRNGGPSND